MPRKKQPKSETLNRYGKPRRFGPSVRLPGFEGPRPLLGFILKVLKGRDPGVMPDMLWNTTQVVPADHEWLRVAHENPLFVGMAQQAMIGTMKQLADLWIDSGKDANGVNDPDERNIQDIPPGHDVSIHQMIQLGLLDHHRPWISLTREGKQHFDELWPMMDMENLASETVQMTLEHYGRKVALYYFFKLLNSPFPYHLSRCDNCKRYFGYERGQKRRIKNGVFCNDCKPKASVIRNVASRTRRIEKKVQFAADVWPQWKSESRHGPRSKWIANKVNRRLGLSDPQITGRWVTQHEIEIQNEIERRKTDAKG